MKLSAILAPLIAAKVPHDVILDAVKAWEAEQASEVDEGKEKARERWRRWKAKQTPANVSKRLPTTANDLREGVTRVEDNLQTKNQDGQEEKKERTAPAARAFADFWEIYPHRVGKRDAEKAFASALQRAGLEAILSGVRRYAAKTDDRPWCNPSTFLNQNRWEDEPAAPVQRAHSPPGRKQGPVEALGTLLEMRRNGRRSSDEGDSADAQRLSTDSRQLSAVAGHIRAGIRPMFDGSD